jgi:uncharacterized protein YecE (DUF72 family)
MAAAIRIGVSGWRYQPWRGQFYPDGLPQRRELEYAARVFSTVEINGSFYSLQRPECYASWYADTPPGFVFAVKGGRFITHMRKLREVEQPLANFLASGVFNLKEKLGPILWQFPPMFKYNRARIEPFLELLPRDTEAACAIARKRAAWMKGRTRLAIDEKRPLRHAIEIRHESFLDPSFIELLRNHNVALVIAETAGRWPLVHDITADFVYIRLHGDKELYRSGYGDKALERWARRIRAWSTGSEPDDAHKVLSKKSPAVSERDVFCFFDNTDVKLRAPVDAQALMKMLGLTPGRGLELPPPQRVAKRRRTATASPNAAPSAASVRPSPATPSPASARPSQAAPSTASVRPSPAAPARAARAQQSRRHARRRSASAGASAH